MKRFNTIVVILLGCAISICAQQTTPPATAATPTNTQTAQPTTRQNPNAEQMRSEQIRAEQLRRRREEDAFNNLRALGEFNPRSANISRVMRLDVAPLYRKPSKKEIEPLIPNSLDTEKYANFLKQKKTGIFVLVPDAGCSDNSKVLVISPECLEYKFPGAGSSYSFRIDNYRLPDLADITYADGTISGQGVLVSNLFVDLGQQDIEKIHLSSPGMKVLTEFRISKTSVEAHEKAKSIMNGYLQNGFAYGLGVFAEVDSTSAVRFIAYRARLIKFVQGVAYDEFSFDKRRDLIVVFRIIRKDPDGRITVIWKELQNKKAPKIKIVDPNSKEKAKKN